ncbi:MAG: hypothetical protein KGI84_09060 [Elusimicrobia bacterium]|nr:hypothetical protein [Elusimicrobiota bacterium]
MNLKGVMLAALAISLAAPRAWADPVMDGFSAAEGFLMDSADQSIAQINPSACAAESASPGETNEQIQEACHASRSQAAAKKRDPQSPSADQQPAANPLQSANEVGDALGGAVSSLSVPSQADNSSKAAKAADQETRRPTMVAHAAPAQSVGATTQYGPDINQGLSGVPGTIESGLKQLGVSPAQQ